MKLRKSLLVATFPSILLGACASSSEPDAFVSRGGRIHDAQGREMILHGVNARVEGIFDVTFDDGRTALEPIPAFTEEDCRFLGEDLGLDHLRLPVNWSAIEPHEGDYRQDYVDRILAVAAMCERHGVLTLVDLHQDAFSKEIGEDGAPLWAILPPPPMLLQGPLLDLDLRRASPEVSMAFDSLWGNTDGLQDKYAAMAAWLAQRIDGRPGVIGLEIMNEPVNLQDTFPIFDFYERVGKRVRRSSPNITLFFEPNSIRNITDTAPVIEPFSQPDSVYSPHVYVDVFEGGFTSAALPKLAQSVADARSEATQHNEAALYVGEFGAGPDATGTLYGTAAMAAFDENLASWAYWVYEERSQGSWGLYDMVAGDPPTRGALRGSEADLLARAYPVAVAGRIVDFHYDTTTHVLTLHVEGARADLDHVLAAPARLYPRGVAITCDGVPVDPSVDAGRARFRCAGSTIVLSPN